MEHKRALVSVVIDSRIHHLYLEFGHTLSEWENQFQDEDFWDFPIQELLDGTIEPDETTVYWVIDGRCYETDILL